MKKIAVIVALCLLPGAVFSCAQAPPAEYLAPEFEGIVIEDSYTDDIRVICTMSSMSQLTEYGLDYTDDFLSEESEWTRVHGIKTGSSQFEVILEHLDPCTTYCYRLFIGNGRNVKQSAQNYFTTPE